jgi:hypothetical protein
MKPDQSTTDDALSSIVLLSILGGNGIIALFDPPETNLKHQAIQETALATFIGWYAAMVLGVATRATFAARAFYTWGCAMCLLHIVVAFHVAYGWSHAAAVEHVKQLSGFGDGIYVNYLFVAVWLADVCWIWVSLDGYRNRPRWVSWVIHGFMGFIIFNAAVVFNRPFGRAVFALFFAAMLYYMWRPRDGPLAERADH